MYFPGYLSTRWRHFQKNHRTNASRKIIGADLLALYIQINSITVIYIVYTNAIIPQYHIETNPAIEEIKIIMIIK